MRNKIKNFNKGFTIIEALVAISILTIAVTGPLSLASKGLSYSSYAKDEITAFYLANEAIDTIRNIRDTNNNSGAAGADNWLKLDSSGTTLVGGSGKDFYFDVWKNPPDLKSATHGDGAVLKTCESNELTRFGHVFSWTGLGGECDNITEESIFSRTVKITPLPDSASPNEIRVTVTVSWETRTGIQRSVVISENLFNLGSI